MKYFISIFILTLSSCRSLPADIGKNIGPGSIFESKNKVMDDVQPLDSWGTSGINQQVSLMLHGKSLMGCPAIHIFKHQLLVSVVSQEFYFF